MNERPDEKDPMASQTLDSEGVITLPLGRAAFWRASEIDGIREAGFLNLAVWLVEVQKPRLVVRLGLNEAQGFIAFCAAAEMIGPGVTCKGFAREADNGRDRALRACSDRRDMIEITDDNPLAALERFADNEIDLLSIDASLPDDVWQGITPELWRKISPEGVIVVAGVMPSPDGQTTRDTLDTLKLERGHWTITDAGGRVATVLFARPDQAPTARFGNDMAAALSASLSRYGDGPATSWRAMRAEQRCNRAQAELGELISARDERHEACATALASLAEQTQARLRLEAEIAPLREAAAALEQTKSLHFFETTALTGEVMKLDALRKKHKSEADTLRAANETVRQERDAILRSTFWRATGPVRSIIDVVRSIRRPQRIRRPET